jgi:hypothetical protein
LYYYDNGIKQLESSLPYLKRRDVGLRNGVLRRIFGPQREEMAGGWRTLHNEGRDHSEDLGVDGNIVLVWI